MTIFVVTIPTKYEIIAVAASQEDALYLAVAKVLDYLAEMGTPYDRPESVLDYFGCHVTEIEIGTATFC